ncbi:MAG: Holliday junction branch migration protein RuvA [Eggerthellaceae bacterium]|jgi:Holliday junction DNA helicase RuvA
MISYLKGILVDTDTFSAVIEVNGIGFEVGMSTKSLARLPERGKPVQVFTVLQVREDGMALFGFSTREEREVFNKLIGVSGVGPKVALGILSTFTPEELIETISTEDISALTRIPGIGKKSASRIVLELKGSLEKGIVDGQLKLQADSAGLKGATEALLSMGFTPQEAELALRDAPTASDEGALLQYALKRLGS